jgi:hypothetical protein
MTYHQPIRIEVNYNSEMDAYIERPVYSPEAYAEANALLDKIIQGAKDNDVKFEYYIREFL